MDAALRDYADRRIMDTAAEIFPVLVQSSSFSMNYDRLLAELSETFHKGWFFGDAMGAIEGSPRPSGTESVEEYIHLVREIFLMTYLPKN